MFEETTAGRHPGGWTPSAFPALERRKYSELIRPVLERLPTELKRCEDGSAASSCCTSVRAPAIFDRSAVRRKSTN